MWHLLLWSALSHAQSEPSTVGIQTEMTSRPITFQVGFRVRRIQLPGAVLNGPFGHPGQDGWPLGDDKRPEIGFMSYGAELAISGREGRKSALIWFSYWDSTMREGYWDDIEDPYDPLDGHWIRPSNNYGYASVGASYAHSAPLVKSGSTNGVFELGFHSAIGLGVIVQTGTLERWEQANDGTPAYLLATNGEPANHGEAEVPKILPVLDATIGFEMVFVDRVVLRLEGGLHNVFTYGLAAGYRF